MLTLHFDVVQLSDNHPIEGAELHLRLHLVPRFYVGRRGDGPEAEPVVELVPDYQRRIELPAPPPGRSDRNGRATIRINADGAMAQMKQLVVGGKRAGDPALVIVPTLRYRTIDQQALSLEGLTRDQAGNLITLPDQTANFRVRIDVGQAIIGHVGPTIARIWAMVPGKVLLNHQVRVSANPEVAGAPRAVPRIAYLTRISGAHVDKNIFVGDVPGLAPGAAYRIAVEVLGTQPGPWLIASGRLVADAPDSGRCKVLFGSCNHPYRQDVEGRWSALLKEADVDAMLHLGDQTYEERIDTPPWLPKYISRYWMTWLNPNIRKAHTRSANYMIFDDHEVADDWGVKNIEAAYPGRVGQALDAYKLFQQAHGPKGMAKDYFYDFHRGPAAFFVLDCRSQRAQIPQEALDQAEDAHKVWRRPPESTLLGRHQRAALLKWADSPQTRGSDVIVLASSIPLAWISVTTYLDYVNKMERAVPWLAGLVASIITPGFVIPLAAAIAGGVVADKLLDGKLNFSSDLVGEHGKAESILTKADLADLWHWPPHQKDLSFVLDVLFALANDLNMDGTPRPNPRRRAVFILAGDVHSGGIHSIRSKDPRHRANPVITQLTSSSLTAPQNALANLLSKDFPGGLNRLNVNVQTDVERLLVNPMAAISVSANVTGKLDFILDDTLEGKYRATLLRFVEQHNYGRLSFRNVGGRQYAISAAIVGRDQRAELDLLLDLDKVPMPTSGKWKLTPSTLNFGTVPFLGIQQRYLTIVNETPTAGRVIITSSTQQPAGEFRWSGFQEDIAPRTQRRIRITFAPTRLGPQRATLKVRINGVDHTVHLAATVVPDQGGDQGGRGQGNGQRGRGQVDIP